MDVSLNDLSILIKYIDYEYINNFKSGEIHFTKLKYFRDKEIIDGDGTIGDKNEGYVIRRYPAEQIKRLEAGIKDDKNNTVNKFNIAGDLSNNKFGHALEYSTTSKNTDSWGISCFTILKFIDSNIFNLNHSFEYSNEKNEFYEIYNFTIKKKFIDKLYYEVGGKNRTPIILFPSFLKRLKQFQKKSDLPVFYNPVKYYSKYDKSNVDLDADWEDQVMQAAFTKSNHYKNQKEFRIISFCDISEFGSNISVGHLQGCYMNCKEQKPRFSIKLQIRLYNEYSSRYVPFLKTRLIIQCKKLSQTKTA